MLSVPAAIAVIALGVIADVIGYRHMKANGISSKNIFEYPAWGALALAPLIFYIAGIIIILRLYY